MVPSTPGFSELAALVLMQNTPAAVATAITRRLGSRCSGVRRMSRNRPGPAGLRPVQTGRCDLCWINSGLRGARQPKRLTAERPEA